MGFVKIIKKEENDRVYLFLAGLNGDLDEVRVRILGKKPRPSLCETFFEIRREEIRRKVMLNNPKPKHVTEMENSALVSRSTESDGERRKKPWCGHCKKPGSENRAFQASHEEN